MADMKYWVWYSSLVGIKNAKRMDLLKHFGDPKKIWHAAYKDFEAFGSIKANELELLTSQRLREETERHLTNIEKYQIQVIPIDNAVYPMYLAEIYDPPIVLYTLGVLEEQEASVAVVGSRKATAYGLGMAKSIATELSRQGITVVSGMARGVDSQAHLGAIEAGGRTIAVLGCGLDTVYPPENAKLMERICQCGAVISEYLPGVPPKAYHFPARNRIISGMSLGVAVVEASEKSGSLITADFALEHGREVFAVPGNINNFNSRGTNRLIREGAKMVTGIEDILEELNLSRSNKNKNKNPLEDSKKTVLEKQRKKTEHKEAVLTKGEFETKSNMTVTSPCVLQGLDEVERKIFECLMGEERHIDAIQAVCGLAMQRVNAALVMLELKGLIHQMPGKMFGCKK